MATKLDKLTPAFAIHPGEVIKDELEEREIKQKDFAELTGIQPSQLNEILNGKRGINAEYALVIGKALQMDPKILLNLQNNYELDKAKINSKTQQRLDAIEQWMMIKPYISETYFRKQGYITGDPISDIDCVKNIYKIDHLEQLPIIYSRQEHARLRKSEKASVEKVNLFAWINLIIYESHQIIVDSFNHTRQNELIDQLRRIIYKNENTIENTRQILHSQGIKLIVLEQPEKCAVDGFAFWSNGNPAIGLSLRFNRVDYFAFTLFHELGHVFLHLVNDNKAEFIDIETEKFVDKESKEEDEANDFAKNNLISPQSWDAFINSNTRSEELSILKLAQKERIHPAVVKGRLCHETGNYRLKTRFKNIIQ